MLRSEIQNAIKSLNLSDQQFKEIGLYQWVKIIKMVEDTFINKKVYNANFQPYWEHLKEIPFSMHFCNNDAFRFIGNIVDIEEKLWFLVQDANKIWLYEGTVKSIIEIIGECYGFEYYLISKQLSWLLCENHHGYLIGVGNPIVDRMKKLQHKKC